MRTFAVAATGILVLVCTSGIQADIAMDWVAVGDPGNADDIHGEGYGGVAYTYAIGKYEVTNARYATFLNSVATVGDPHGLYCPDMAGGWNDTGGISRSGLGTASTPWVYVPRAERGNRPVNYVSWYDCLRFANWLHNGQGQGDTEDGAYDMSLGESVVRKPGATVFLTSEDEWYKAAYYKGGSTDAGYWSYPTKSDTLPGRDMTESTNPGNNANYHGSPIPIDSPHYTTVVGEFELSSSPYGTFDQGGNLWEWNESAIGEYRAYRGGAFGHDGFYLNADRRGHNHPADEAANFGFRVAMVPEPAAFPLLVLAGFAIRRRKH